jgi:hypothetical protein
VLFIAPAGDPETPLERRRLGGGVGSDDGNPQS